MADNHRFERVFSRLEKFERKLYLLNEDVASIKQQLTTIKDTAENEVKRQMKAIRKDLEKNMEKEMMERKNEGYHRGRF